MQSVHGRPLMAMVFFDIRLSRKPIRGTAKLVHILLIMLVSMLTLFGMFANRFTLRGRQRFIFSKKYLAYAMMVTTIFSSIYVRQMYMDFTNSQLNLRDAVKVYGYMNVIVAIINFVTQLVMSKTVAHMMSQVPLFETINSLHIDGRTIMTSVLMAMIKVLGFPLIMEVALVYQQKHYEPHLSFGWTIYKLFPMIISNFLNNCYFGAIIIAKNIMEALNARLKMQVQQVNFMQQEQHTRLFTKYFRIQQFCTLADELESLSIKYKLICEQATDYMALMSLSIVLSLICHILGITVGVYNQYYAIAESVIGGKPYDGFGALINMVFLVISLMEVALLTYLSNDVLKETQATGIILQEIDLYEADWRYRREVHAFALLVVSIKYRIKPMGLFEMDVTLINNVLSTVASFSLILVQSDLSQRFKQP